MIYTLRLRLNTARRIESTPIFISVSAVIFSRLSESRLRVLHTIFRIECLEGICE